jgi:hypothetical protein
MTWWHWYYALPPFVLAVSLAAGLLAVLRDSPGRHAPRRAAADAEDADTMAYFRRLRVSRPRTPTPLARARVRVAVAVAVARREVPPGPWRSPELDRLRREWNAAVAVRPVVPGPPVPPQAEAETALLADAGIEPRPAGAGGEEPLDEAREGGCPLCVADGEFEGSPFLVCTQRCEPSGFVPFRGELTAYQVEEFRQAVRASLRDEHGHFLPPGSLAAPPPWCDWCKDDPGSCTCGDLARDPVAIRLGIVIEPTLPPLPARVLEGTLHAAPDVARATFDADVTDFTMRAVPASVLTREHVARVMQYTSPGSLRDFVDQVMAADGPPLVDAQLALTGARIELRAVAGG